MLNLQIKNLQHLQNHKKWMESHFGTLKRILKSKVVLTIVTVLLILIYYHHHKKKKPCYHHPHLKKKTMNKISGTRKLYHHNGTHPAHLYLNPSILQQRPYLCTKNLHHHPVNRVKMFGMKIPNLSYRYQIYYQMSYHP